MKIFLPVGALIPLLAFPSSTAACSAVSCIDKGVELRRNFLVRVTHGGKPLPGVTVSITISIEHKITKPFSGVTAADGTVRVKDLPPGEYWLNAELLGVVAGTGCFHVNPHAKSKAKKEVNYEWGDLAQATRKIAGSLTDSQPGQDGTPIWNLFHRVERPISGASLKLQDPMTGAVHNVQSNADGQFLFDPIPNGIYVLHIDGGTAPGGRPYAPADLLVRLSDHAKGDTLFLTWRDAGGGSCGGTSLEVRNTPIKKRLR